MRLLRFLFSLCVHVALLLVAVDGLLMVDRPVSILGPGVPGAELTTTAEHFTWLHARLGVFFDSPREMKIFWGVLLALVLVSWLMSLLAIRIRPRPLKVRTTQGDMLLLDPSAIINFTHAQVENHPAVKSHRVAVRQVGGRTVAITARLKVIPIASLPEIKRELEAQIRDGFAQVLGIEKIDEVTLILGLDEKDVSRRPGAAQKAEPPALVPARGVIESSTSYGDDDALPATDYSVDKTKA